ncbi:hypothetical protein EHM94_05725 [Marinobacter sp. NP-6]|uniref:hypothetical protein n=1 Tax=Marinobacter sp. NP-6 TaxID=2488666 RepID=UPI000FCC8FD6|nr:hypothetical protein [Marinobacter sp. NP-6]RUT74692.1 hypothetical protein EHM94_05725 [Marinobacter sp. NP-6]
MGTLEGKAVDVEKPRRSRAEQILSMVGEWLVKEYFRDLVIEIKALKKAAMFLKPQIAEKAVVKAAQTMESMIEEIDTLKARVAELEGGNSGKS